MLDVWSKHCFFRLKLFVCGTTRSELKSSQKNPPFVQKEHSYFNLKVLLSGLAVCFECFFFHIIIKGGKLWIENLRSLHEKFSFCSTLRCLTYPELIDWVHICSIRREGSDHQSSSLLIKGDDDVWTPPPTLPA